MNDSKKGFTKLNAVRGWLFDVYPVGPDEVAVWIITENGQRVRLVDKYVQKVHVCADSVALNRLAEKLTGDHAVASWRFAKKQPDFMNSAKRRVLEISVNDYRKTFSLAREVLKLNGFRVYNVDVPVAQAYLYDKNIFPLAYLMAVDSGKQVYYDVLDSVESVDYRTPPLKPPNNLVQIETFGPAVLLPHHQLNRFHILVRSEPLPTVATFLPSPNRVIQRIPRFKGLHVLRPTIRTPHNITTMPITDS